MDFKVKTAKRSPELVGEIAERIKTTRSNVQAVITIESAGKGTFADGRLKMLNEPHIFYRELEGEQRALAVKQGLAYQKWGAKPYPKTAELRYAWLAKAMKINEEAALRSCSWGLPQIMGFNHEAAGYPSAKAMVEAFAEFGDAAQLNAMATFITANKRMIKALRESNWSVFAELYNGKGYEKNGYHTKLAAADKAAEKTGIDNEPIRVTAPAVLVTAAPVADPVPVAAPVAAPEPVMAIPVVTIDAAPTQQTFVASGEWTKPVAAVPVPVAVPAPAPVPAEPAKADVAAALAEWEVQGLQRRLEELGYVEVGYKDGDYAGRTIGAISAFQFDNGIKVSGLYDEATREAMRTAKPRQVSPQRASTTVADLRAEGSPIIKETDRSKLLSLFGAVIGFLTVVWSAIIENVGSAIDALTPLKNAFGFVPGWLWGVLVVGTCFYLWHAANTVQKTRVEDERLGRVA